MPGDLQMLWRARDPKQYHVEYGYSCMGYEIAGGLGAKLADPGREVFVLVGDGSYLMMASEIVTAVSEGIKLNIILVQNQGLRLHRLALGVARLAAVRHQLPLPQPGDRAARRRHPARRPGRERGQPGRRRAQDPDRQGFHRRPRAGQGVRPDHGRLHRNRPARPRPVLGELVGRARLARPPRWTARSRPARPTRRPSAISDCTCEERSYDPQLSSMRTIQHWIAGSETTGASTRFGTVWNPATGAEQAQVALAEPADVDAAVAAASKASAGVARRLAHPPGARHVRAA